MNEKELSDSLIKYPEGLKNNQLVSYSRNTLTYFKYLISFDHLLIKLKVLIIFLYFFSILVSFLLIELLLFLLIYRIIQAYEFKSFQILFKYMLKKIYM